MDKALFKLKGIRAVLAKLAALTVIQAGMIITQAFYLAAAISSLFGGDSFHHAARELAIFFLALTIRQGAAVWKKHIAFHFAAYASETLHAALLEKLFRLGPRFVKKEGSGQTVTLVIEGITKYRHYLELSLVKLLNMALIPMAIMIFILSLNVRSAVILTLALPLLVIFMILLGLAAKTKADRQYESYHLLSNHFVDSLRGLETLKYLGLAKSHVNKIAYVSEQYRKATLASLKIAFLSSFALDFFTMLSIATVAVFLGLDLINGGMYLHPALTILILAPEYFVPIRELGSDYHATLDGKNAGKKIIELLERETFQELDTLVPVWDSSTNFTIKGLSVQYDDDYATALEDIELNVTGAKTIGIIGSSGAGKSTLIDVLSGFLKQESGDIQINQQRVETLAAKSWQRQLSYIPQHPYIFHDTVLNNIRFYHPDAQANEVYEAARYAGLLDVIESLPEGLATMIGDGGRHLSGGQEQRIALARSFLGKRSIIMLDEPTAHLDIETELELKEKMLDFFKGKLVFLATHRLHWMREMDEIIVLEHGRIVESGDHKQLLANKSVYYQLVKAQEGEV